VERAGFCRENDAPEGRNWHRAAAPAAAAGRRLAAVPARDVDRGVHTGSAGRHGARGGTSRRILQGVTAWPRTRRADSGWLWLRLQRASVRRHRAAEGAKTPLPPGDGRTRPAMPDTGMISSSPAKSNPSAQRQSAILRCCSGKKTLIRGCPRVSAYWGKRGCRGLGTGPGSTRWAQPRPARLTNSKA